jgi:hypothetical protein
VVSRHGTGIGLALVKIMVDDITVVGAHVREVIRWGEIRVWGEAIVALL